LDFVVVVVVVDAAAVVVVVAVAVVVAAVLLFDVAEFVAAVPSNIEKAVTMKTVVVAAAVVYD